MTVYGEVLFVENFITGWVILLLTGKIRGIKIQKDQSCCGIKRIKCRIVAGSLICGVYAFILFVPLHWLAVLASKLLFSVVVVLIVFGAGTWRSLIKTTAVFYIVSFLMGGVTIALMYMIKIPGMTGNGSFMLKGATFLQITAGVAVTWYLGSWLAGVLREKIHKTGIIRTAELHIGGHTWMLKAMVDTGNSLKDPVTGWPVAVLSKDVSENICIKCDGEQFPKFSAIPYRTVNKASVMFGIRPDYVMVDGLVVKNIVLGFGERNFSPWKGTEKYDLLLHQQFLEGEDMTHGQEYDYDSKSVGKV